jgi:glycerophosphoryl diester phosphodiesterase
MSAFKLAIEQNADVIELDAKLSADEQVVIIHDQTVDRTTDGTDQVSDLQFAALRELNASSQFPGDSEREQIPTLEEVFEAFGGRVLINIELGNYRSPFDALPIKVSELISDFALGEQVLISSFHPVPLRRFKQLLPSVPIGFLAKRGIKGFLSRSWFGRSIVPYQALHLEKSDVSPNLVKVAQLSGHRVHAYTVNEHDEMARLFSLGIDGIITDNPSLARQVLETNQP